MRSVIIAVTLGLLVATPTLSLDDPDQLIRALYKRPSIPIRHVDIDRYFARDMAAAIKLDIGDPSEVGTYNGGDWRYDAQDFKISDLSITKATTTPGGAEVTATFKNFGKAGKVTYTLCLAKTGWKIADVRPADWDLRKALKLPASPVRC